MYVLYVLGKILHSSSGLVLLLCLFSSIRKFLRPIGLMVGQKVHMQLGRGDAGPPPPNFFLNEDTFMRIIIFMWNAPKME